MKVKRITTGINGLDELIEGGIPEGSCILLSGSSGTGKTIFCLQFLIEGTKKGEPGIYVTLDELKDSIILCGERFGWNLQELERDKKLTILEYMDVENESYLNELYELKKGTSGKIENVNEAMDELMRTERIKQIMDMVTKPSIISQHERELAFLSKLEKDISEINPKRLVIDSISSYMIHDRNREALHRFIQKIRRFGITCILIAELVDGEYTSGCEISEFMVDGVIVLSIHEALDSRIIKISKMRETKHSLKPRAIELTDRGIEIPGFRME